MSNVSLTFSTSVLMNYHARCKIAFSAFRVWKSRILPEKNELMGDFTRKRRSTWREFRVRIRAAVTLWRQSDLFSLLWQIAECLEKPHFSCERSQQCRSAENRKIDRSAARVAPPLRIRAM